MAPSSDPPSRTSTPRSFTNQSTSPEELFKSQTVGLVNLSDFRKRRAEVLEQKEKEAQDRTFGRFKPSASGTSTPGGYEVSDGALTPRNGLDEQPPRKKKKAAKGLLSFNDEEGDADRTSQPTESTAEGNTTTARDSTALPAKKASIPRRLTPNPNAAVPAPKVFTKAALQAEAAARDELRREFLELQEKVKNTEIIVPFVFYDGTNIPGGAVRVKKGDHIWLFLDRCRKVGAELGVAGGANSTSKSKNDSRKEWARVGVDDLMCVRGDIMIPHHFEFYHFIANRVPNPSKSGGLLFDYSNSAPKQTYDSDLLLRPSDKDLEGKDHDPNLTKVVDRRWYERNKHIFPASLWKEYEAGKDFEDKVAQMKRDTQGNAFFF